MEVTRQDIHPSHEEWTGKPYHAIGETVYWLSYPGIVVAMQGVGDDKMASFEYKVKLENGEVTNFVTSSDIRKREVSK